MPRADSRPPAAGTERGKQGAAIEGDAPSPGGHRAPAVGSSGSPCCVHGLTHGEFSDPFGPRPCNQWAAKGWCPPWAGGLLPSCHVLQLPPSPPACPRCPDGAALGRPSLCCRAGALRFGGGVWGAPEPGKRPALCQCDWPYLLAPRGTPSPSQPCSAPRAGGTQPPRAPQHSPMPPAAAAAGCSWAHTVRMPTSKMPAVFMVLPWVLDGLCGLAGVYICMGLGRGCHAHNLRVPKLLLHFGVVPEAATAPRRVIA